MKLKNGLTLYMYTVRIVIFILNLHTYKVTNKFKTTYKLHESIKLITSVLN